MLLNVDQLQKQLDKDEFQEDGSMAAFWVVNNQFQKFINSKFTLDYDSQMTETYFVEYTGLGGFTLQRYNLLQHLDDSSRSGNDTDADDADIRPIYDEEPMTEIGKRFAIAALKNDLRKLKGNSVDTKFDKTSVLGETGCYHLYETNHVVRLSDCI
ncbi:hypothetical protein Tco_1345818 [Tanacetum coccineum]